MDTSEYLLETSREYAIYVCDSRGIPFVADGLKHSQRMALWLLRNRAEKMKTFSLSGLLGYEKLYVHGETSANNAINLLAAPFKNNIPLIQGEGQFGSRIAPVEGIGAPRYTDVRRSKAAEAFLYKDLDLVPMAPNYDGSNQQPIHFLPLIPTVLLNGVVGVAVGWSTAIEPRALKTLIQATKAALTGKPMPNLDPRYARYDITVTPTGPNQWEYAGKVEIVDTSTVRITELPPGLALETFRARLIAMEENDTIADFTDRSADSIDITVKFKRGTIKGMTEADAITLFKLKEKVTERIVVIGNLALLMDAERALDDAVGHTAITEAKAAMRHATMKISQYANAEELIREFVAWRLGWYTRRFSKMVRDASHELVYWQVLDALFAAKFPTRLGGFVDKTAVEADVLRVATKAALTPDDGHIARIVELPTYRWTTSFHELVTTKIAELHASIAEYNAILASPDRRKTVYLDELDALAKEKL